MNIDLTVEKLGEILRFCDLGKFKDATSCFSRLGEIKRADASLLYRLGHEFLRETKRNKRNLDLAIISFYASVCKDPDSFEAMFSLGRAFREKGSLRIAAVVFEESCRLNPRNIRARLQLAAVFCQLCDYDEAIKVLSDALLLFPSSSDIYRRLGVCFEQKGSLSAAMDAFRKALQLNPKKVENYLALANILATRGNLKGFRALQRMALKVDPQSASLIRNHSQRIFKLFMSQKRYYEAVEILEELGGYYGDREHRVVYWLTDPTVSKATGKKTKFIQKEYFDEHRCVLIDPSTGSKS
jgi:tetratricopeptide (TPR) repeat protein